MMRMVLAMGLVFSAGIANAQNTVGNGGDMLVCSASAYNGKILDYYQAREEWGLAVDLGAPTLNWQGKVQYALDRLATVSPQRAAQYRAWFTDFVNGEAEFVSGKSLVDIPDTGAVVLPADCHVQQVAVQRNDQELNIYPKRYTIDNDLWINSLDEDQRAILVLHELIYREVLHSEISNSLFVRYMNAHVISPSVLTADQMDLNIRAKRGFYEAGGHIVTAKYGLDGEPFPLEELHSDAPTIRMDYFGFDKFSGRACKYISLRDKNYNRFSVSGCSGEPWQEAGDAKVYFYRFGGVQWQWVGELELPMTVNIDPVEPIYFTADHGVTTLRAGTLSGNLVVNGIQCKPGYGRTFSRVGSSSKLSLRCYLD